MEGNGMEQMGIDRNGRKWMGKKEGKNGWEWMRREKRKMEGKRGE
jgi:hypothetical protein